MTERKATKILHGFLSGIGFSFAFVLVIAAALYAYSQYMRSEIESVEITSMSRWKQYDENAGLAIMSHRPIRRENNLEIVGVVENNGTDTWQSISIEVELFDSEGNFMDECSEYISSALAPKQSENFKVSCGGCEKRPLAEFDRYEIAIKDASYQMKQDDI